MMNDTESTTNHLLAVDTHVHLHDWTNLIPMLDNALESFSRAADLHKQTSDFSGILALTEPRDRNTFSRLRAQQENSAGPCNLNKDWLLEPTGEPHSMTACHTGGKRIHLLSGQQIVTREKLEVLSIFAPSTVADGLPVRETIDEIENLNGFPVIPWGVGKWLFGRGKIVTQLIDEERKKRIGIGDNGSRPAFWKGVPQFEQAARHDLPLLHGSDPLRVSETRRGAGSSGDLIVCPFDSRTPGQSLVRAFSNNSFERIPFGTPELAGSFFRDQIALRLG